MQMSQEDNKSTPATAVPVTDNKNKLENIPELEKNYEKEIDLIINKAFSTQ